MTGDAAMTHCTAPKRDGSPFEFNRLILPFKGPDGAVNRLLVVFCFDPIALARLSGTLQVRREIPEEARIGPTAIFGNVLQARQAG
jgi:hypothetical protein